MINHNRAPWQAGGRATEGWPRRGETRGSERVKGHREHREKPGQGRLAERTQTPGAKRRICQFGRHPTREVPRNHPTHSQIDEFAKAAPDPTSGSLLGVFCKATLERNPTPLAKSPKESGHWYHAPHPAKPTRGGHFFLAFMDKLKLFVTKQRSTKQ